MKQYTKDEVLKHLREHMQATRGDKKTAAAKLGFSLTFINDVLGDRREVSDALARSLGFHKMPERWTRKIPEGLNGRS